MSEGFGPLDLIDDVLLSDLIHDAGKQDLSIFSPDQEDKGPIQDKIHFLLRRHGSSGQDFHGKGSGPERLD